MRAGASSAKTVQASVSGRWDGRVPIILGATGHRNIDTEDEKLIAVLRKQCRDLRKRYKCSPFLILSALAEGADRLIAEIAMEELSADLIAILPMPEEDYEKDFASEESKTQFRDLLDRALYIRIAPLPAEDASWKAGGEPRNEQYARAGAIIADHAQIFFAIWDDEPARGTGGTAQQVEWFQRGHSPKKYSLYNGELTFAPPRPGQSVRIDPQTAEVSIDPPARQHGGKNMQLILERMNSYNRDIVRHKGLIANSSAIAIPGKGEIEALKITDAIYRGADCLSVYFSDKLKRSDKIIYALALAAVGSFNFISSKYYAPWAYLSVTLVMAMLASGAWLGSLDDRFLEYRCLAEGLRTLFFWRSAGVERPVWLAYFWRNTSVSDPVVLAYSARKSAVVHWIRHAVRAVEFCQDCQLEASRNNSVSERVDGIQFAKHFWVDNQKHWFASKEREHFESFKFWRWSAGLALGASFATAIILASLTLISNGKGGVLWNDWVKPDPFGDFWQAGLGLFAAGGLAARGFLERRAHLQLTKKYASQRQIFESASLMLNSVEHDKEPKWTAKEILEKLGEDTLQEQEQWLWLRHSRPFELPGA
jgi:hypothetical protein